MEGSVLIVGMDGEIDHHSAEHIRKKIDSQIVFGNIKRIVFDFSKVSFMDSSGIGIVMGRYRNMQNLHGSTAIANVTPHIRRVFEMAGISKFVRIYDNMADAVNSM